MKSDQNPANLKQAIAYYSQSVILDPNSVDGHFDLAFALFAKKDLKGALDQLDEVLKLDPKNEKALSLKRQIIL
jgi:tetratricopeptide (TPR) repeat protein